MSRLDCALGADADCVAGYDWAMGSYFFHSGREDSRGRPKVSAGSAPGAAASVGDLEAAIAAAAKRPGFAFPHEFRAALAASALAEIISAEGRGSLPRERASALLASAGAGIRGEGGHARP